MSVTSAIEKGYLEGYSEENFRNFLNSMFRYKKARTYFVSIDAALGLIKEISGSIEGQNGWPRFDFNNALDILDDYKYIDKGFKEEILEQLPIGTKETRVMHKRISHKSETIPSKPLKLKESYYRDMASEKIKFNAEKFEKNLAQKIEEKLYSISTAWTPEKWIVSFEVANSTIEDALNKYKDIDFKELRNIATRIVNRYGLTGKAREKALENIPIGPKEAKRISSKIQKNSADLFSKPLKLREFVNEYENFI